MTNKTLKSPLDFDLYAQYEIPQEYMAYKVTFNDIGQEQSDDLELEYTLKGYKVFHSEMSRIEGNKFQLIIIIAKSEITF